MHFEQRSPLILELGLRPEALPILRKYLDLLWSANEELNLVSRKMSFEELIDQHVIDCLLPLRYFPSSAQQIADFGTGGGLPGVLYAIQFPEKSFHFFEKSPKKRDFLKRCLALAPNVQLHAEITPQLPDLDLIMGRAFKPIDVILDLSRRYCDEDGEYFLLKGRREKIDEEVQLARKKFKNFKVELIPLSSPVAEGERHLVRINPKA